ncbi:MAG: hypothetical protein JWN30_2225 [Bacilli bacterium]|nr:hypothetical protein [Bacilli bacterium]
MKSSILEIFTWTLIRNLVVEQDYTCFAPGALFQEPCLFRAANNRGLLIRPIQADGKTAAELVEFVNEGFRLTEEFLHTNRLRSATIVHLFLYEQQPALTMRDSIRVLERHQSYPDISLYAAVYCLENDSYHFYAPFYAKRLLPGAVVRKAAAEMPNELNLSQLQSQMNQAGEKRRQEWSRLFIQTSSKGTYTFIAFCILIYGWMLAEETGVADTGQLLIKFGEKVNSLIAAGQYWRLLSPIFLHINLIHILVNMIGLYSLRVVEWIFGSYRFLFIFLLAGIGGNTFSFAMSPNPSAGASGALFGLLGALIYFGFERWAVFKRVFSTGVWLTLAVNIILGFTWGYVDNWAHIGGLICGFLAALLVGLPGDEKISFKKIAAGIIIVGLLFGGITLGTSHIPRLADQGGAGSQHDLTLKERSCAEQSLAAADRAVPGWPVQPGDTNL